MLSRDPDVSRMFLPGQYMKDPKHHDIQVQPQQVCDHSKRPARLNITITPKIHAFGAIILPSLCVESDAITDVFVGSFRSETLFIFEVCSPYPLNGTSNEKFETTIVYGVPPRVLCRLPPRDLKGKVSRRTVCYCKPNTVDEADEDLRNGSRRGASTLTIAVGMVTYRRRGHACG